MVMACLSGSYHALIYVDYVWLTVIRSECTELDRVESTGKRVWIFFLS